MLKLLVIILTLSSFFTKAQEIEQDQCARTGSLKTEDIVKNFPFNQAKEIKLVSFKGRGDEPLDEIPKVNGQVDIKQLFEIKVVSSTSKPKLLDMLMNINYIPLKPISTDKDSVKTFERSIRAVACYNPRNAILFENNRGEIFAYKEICFECSRVKTQPEVLGVGDFCYEKYVLLENFFRDNGIHYGTN